MTMMKAAAPSFAEDLLSMLSPFELAQFLKFWRGSLLQALLNDWRSWAREQQIAPDGDWRAWVFLGGRGAGKTRAGAEWVSELVRWRKARRVALIGPTFHDVREVMIEGASGIRGLPCVRPLYEASRRRLVWPNGAQAYCFSAEDSEALRGPQFDAAWADELCFWAEPEETLATLEHGLRLGQSPKLLVTTTPKPIAALKVLLNASDTVVTQSSTFENAHNLAPDFISALRERWSGTAHQRQELLGHLIEDVEGALWTRAQLEALRTSESCAFDRVVVAVDPPASVGAKADACGIIAAGVYGDGPGRRAVILADATVQGAAPHEWAARAASLARSLGADAIVAEANNGGEMVRSVLNAAAPEFLVRLVRAAEGKRARAEPVATFYARGLVTHAGAFTELEDEMCAFGVGENKRSPDRVDALVWALTDLLMGGAGPRVRVL